MFDISHEIVVRAPREAVMKAVTSPDGLNAWWTKKCSGRLMVGELYNFYFSEDFSWWAYVADYQENSLVVYDFCDADEDWTGTKLHFGLQPKTSARQILSLDHTGWQHQNEHFHRTDRSWLKYLNKLKVYLETGVRASNLECDV